MALKTVGEMQQEAEDAARALFKEHDLVIRTRDLFRVNDPVTVRCRPGARPPDGYEAERYPFGRSGTVVGFPLTSISRFQRYAYPKVAPGFYLNKEYVIVRFGEYLLRTIRAEWLALPEEIDKERRAESREQYSEVNDIPPVFVCPFPEDRLGEGDVVRLKGYHWVRKLEKLEKGSFPGHSEGFVVSGVNYGTQEVHFIESLDNPARYFIADRLYLVSEGYYSDVELELLERGNLWRRAHGEKLVFHDLAEEAVFFYRIGECKEWRSSKHVRSVWSQEGALGDVRDGRGHGIRYFNDTDLDITDEGYKVVRYEDETLGARIREATLSTGFEIPSFEIPSPDVRRIPRDT